MQAELDKVVAALKDLYGRDAFLFDHDLGERTLTHRLAVHLERQFSGFEVDCNYDRLGARTMQLPHGSIVSTDDHLGKSIYPDIVVHQREIPNNLIAIEVRKAGNHQPIGHDEQKLIALTDPHLWFAYGIGLILTLGKAAVIAVEVFVAGKREDELSGLLSRQLRQAGIGTS